jgi:hypothetical protein
MLADVPTRGNRIDAGNEIGTGVAREVIVRAAGKSDSERRTRLEGLGVGKIPTAEQRVEDAALVHELAALAEGQFVGEYRDEAVTDVVMARPFYSARL